jgi:hypothetical protein
LKPPSTLVRSLSQIKQEQPRIGEAMDDLKSASNNLAHQLATDPNGKADVIPAQVAQVQAQHLGNGLVDVSITDNSSLSRAINYHVEYSADAGFTNPRGAPLGPWRTGTIVLPNGTWYIRAYSQYPAGGPPSNPVNAQSPIVVSEAATGVLFASQGSGTGTPNSGGGAGSGKTISR